MHCWEKFSNRNFCASMSLLAGAFALTTAHSSMAAEARKLACLELYATDGDSITCDGTNMRDMGDVAPFVSGYDTPETYRSKCDKELQLGQTAKKRMDELLSTPGIQVIDSGRFDKTSSRRPLVWVKLPNGQTVGNIMIAEGLARRWSPGYKADWCPD